MVDELSRYLTKHGHEVHLLTGFPTYPTGKLHKGFKRRKIDSQVIKGVYVHRLWSTLYGEGFIRRILFFYSWSLAVRIFGRRFPKPDLIYTEIPPPSSAVAAIKLSRYFKCSTVARIQDMHPDSAIASGFIRNSLLISLLRKEERWIYDNLDKILVIGNGFYNTLQNKKVPIKKIATCPNWIDLAEISPKPSHNSSVRKHFGISNKQHIILYAGTMGRSHGTGVFLDAAKLLQNIPGEKDVLLVFVGRGHERKDLESRIQEEKITNVLLFAPVERKELADMLSMAKLTLVSLRPEFGNLSIPSKVLGYMAAGRPVLALTDKKSDTAKIIEEANCGEVIQNNDPAALADSIQRWVHNDELCLTAGLAARRYCERHLHPEILLNKITSELEMVAR